MSKYTETELNGLLKQYNGFIHMMARKYYVSLRDYDFEDLLQEFRMKFIEGAEIHDDEKGKLTTFTGLLMKNHFLYLLRSQFAEKRPDYLLTLDEDISDDGNSNTFSDIAVSMYEPERTPNEHEFYERMERQIKQELLKMQRGNITYDYFINEMSTQEIADKYNISVALVKYVNKINIMKLKTTFKDYIRGEGEEDSFNLEEFNETYDKEFFNGK